MMNDMKMGIRAALVTLAVLAGASAAFAQAPIT